MPPSGLILTSTTSLPLLKAHLDAGRCGVLKVVTGWGWRWDEQSRRAVAAMADTLIVRTVAGDPSYAKGARRYPIAADVVAEIAPWYAVRPDIVIEIGNEPLIEPQPEEFAWSYLHHFAPAIRACRTHFPLARILAPAHLVNHQIRLGDYQNGVARFVAITRDAYQACDGIGIHAYSQQQLDRNEALYAGGGKPLWLTEFALNEALSPAQRGQRYRAMLDAAPVAAATLYHLDEIGGDDPTHFNPNYRLDIPTLTAMASPTHPPAPSDPDTIDHPQRIDGFTIDIIQWRTVRAFRAHLERYSYKATAPWATGVTVHHTVKPAQADWTGVPSMLGMARYYRDTARWKSGPHLFVVSGSRDPLSDGIWQMSPLNLPSVHGNACNSDRWGVEVVGSYDYQRWDAGTSVLALGAIEALLTWAGRSSDRLNGHRDCAGVDKDKTCPGEAINLAAVRRGVDALRGVR